VRRTCVESDAPGCLTIPLLIIVVPIRLLWEGLSALGRLVQAYIVRPIGWLLYNGLVRPLWWLLRVLVLQPLWWVLRVLVLRPLWWVLRVFVLLPARWIWQQVLVPLGRILFRYVLKPLWAALAWVLTIVLVPFAHLARWLVRGLVALWRAVLWPVLVAFGRLIAQTWRLAGLVLFHLLVRPVRFLWRVLVRPVLRAIAYVWRVTVVRAARWARVHVWEPARVAGRSISRALGLDSRRP
jgi:hypothetical protein